MLAEAKGGLPAAALRQSPQSIRFPRLVCDGLSVNRLRLIKSTHSLLAASDWNAWPPFANPQLWVDGFVESGALLDLGERMLLQDS